MKALQHFKTITRHKLLVMQGCFRLGLYKQGLLHDLSKYGWTEFKKGCQYYQGTRSPNDAEREAYGLSYAWLHHKGRNKHHYEYWIDYEAKNNGPCLAGMRMPDEYVVEMFVDRIAASKIYKGEAYKDSDPLDYFTRAGVDNYIMHKDVKRLIYGLLKMLAEQGEEKTFRYIRKKILPAARKRR
ncbi:MAG: catalase [Ruminococcus sp.]|nr:catalase [Ruminococcus sp.]